MGSVPTDLEALAIAGAQLERLAAGLPAEGWRRATPCTEWTVGDLVDHVVGGNVFTVEVLGGATADAAMATTMSTFGEDYDRRATLVDSLRRQLDAFSATGALDGRYDHVERELSGTQIVRARVHDLVIHGWDLAESVAPPATVRSDLVEWASRELRSEGSLTAQAFRIDATQVSDSPALVAAFGRRPLVGG